MFLSMISLLSHMDSRDISLELLDKHQLTKHYNVDTFGVKLFGQLVSSSAGTIVRVVNHNLTILEKVPDKLLASVRDLFAQGDGLWALLAYVRLNR